MRAAGDLADRVLQIPEAHAERRGERDDDQEHRPLRTRTQTGTAGLRGVTVYRVYCGNEGGSVT